MDEKDTLEFEDYGITFDLKEIEVMDEKQINECKERIKRIKAMLKERMKEVE